MENPPARHKSILIDHFRELIDFANRYFVLSKYVISGNKDIFIRIEKMMVGILMLSVVVLFTLQYMPLWLAIALSVLFAQRILEFIIVYSRNFIFHRGRIFTDFKDPQQQGEWLIMTFSLNILQMVIIFSIWYHLISLIDSTAFFGAPMTVFNSVYFSVITFMTVGYGDIAPLSTLAKTLVLIQNGLTFYTLVIVVNGLISIHFKK